MARTKYQSGGAKKKIVVGGKKKSSAGTTRRKTTTTKTTTTRTTGKSGVKIKRKTSPKVVASKAIKMKRRAR